MRKLAYIFSGIAVVLAVMTLLKTNLLASDGKKMQETVTGVIEAREKVGRLEEEISRAKSLKTVTARAGEMGFTGAAVKRVEKPAELAAKYGGEN